jgi:dTDP-4-amino-4,6-dideoxygalactose transaminase
MIRYGQQDITQADIDAVVAVLKSVNLTQGPAITQFEQSVADHTGAKHAVAVSNATAALHIACLALDLGPGDWLWTTPNTFVASANCALYCGARVDFVDTDPRTYNICPQKLEAKLIQAQKVNKLPKVVVPVHLTDSRPSKTPRTPLAANTKASPLATDATATSPSSASTRSRSSPRARVAWP